MFYVNLFLQAPHMYTSLQLSKLNRQTIVLESLICIVILFIDVLLFITWTCR